MILAEYQQKITLYIYNARPSVNAPSLNPAELHAMQIHRQNREQQNRKKCKSAQKRPPAPSASLAAPSCDKRRVRSVSLYVALTTLSLLSSAFLTL